MSIVKGASLSGWPVVAVVGIGDEGVCFDETEHWFAEIEVVAMIK